MKTYPSRLEKFDLGKWGKIEFNQWIFPGGGPASFSEAEVDRISTFVPKASFVVDIGGFTGDTAIPLALATGHTGKVLVFEPGPASFDYLVSNVSRNGLYWVDPVKLAVTAQEGIHTFHYTDDGFINGGFSSTLDIGPEGCGNPVPLDVEGVHLSKFLSRSYNQWVDRLSFVKIDTEGFDAAIVEDNADLFRVIQPVIQVEVYPFLSIRERQRLVDAIQGIGYKWEGGPEVFLTQVPTPADVLCFPR